MEVNIIFPVSEECVRSSAQFCRTLVPDRAPARSDCISMRNYARPIVALAKRWCAPINAADFRRNAIAGFSARGETIYTRFALEKLPSARKIVATREWSHNIIARASSINRPICDNIEYIFSDENKNVLAKSYISRKIIILFCNNILM